MTRTPNEGRGMVETFETEIAVREYLQRHAGRPVGRRELYQGLHLTRGGLSSAVDRLTFLDRSLAEDDRGRLIYLAK